MKANNNTLDAEGMKGIQLLPADKGLQLKRVSCGHVEGALFLDNGSLSAATEHPTSLDNPVLDDIPSTLGVSSRTRKHESNSSDESSSKIWRRTYDSEASVSARRALDPIDEDEFASTSDVEQKKMFSAKPVGYHRLTPLQIGIIEDPYIKCSENIDRKNPGDFFKGLKVALQKTDKTNIVLTLGDIIHRQGRLIGRNTCVVVGESQEWPRKQLVVKISYPSIYRDSGQNLVDAAKAKAREMASEGKESRLLDHLPEILHSQDFPSNDNDLPQRRLMDLLTGATYADRMTDIYDLYKERFPRITVSKCLFPITNLTNVKDIAQVFFDILQCHRWLYDHAKILHRDISMANVMYRRRPSDNKVCGVLNDFDLSSSFPQTEAASLHRAGTPHMAHDLLDESYLGYLYRHDVEALYYVLLMLCCRYEIVEIKKVLTLRPLQENPSDMPFTEWFNGSLTWRLLSADKKNFLDTSEKLKSVPISPSFSSFLPCLRRIRRAFAKSISARIQPDDEEPIPDEPFDDETLGGHITYINCLRFMSVISVDGLDFQYEEWQRLVP
ncbi:hypothetical protein EDD18DRAFT_1466506 [Armillaria luteobubalina]|uniref:Protein kinase domain-containing protein n=1 Tax=Armillaria luteobubalina TaxID=153913 RepID=A0AA39PPX4_9AGAR|nr:hypothetical protein EDD18DRAFT_1466506 [Armillaria luteobubalina]